MAETLVLARPYAKAVFELAAEQKRLHEWLQCLEVLAAIQDVSAMKALLADPRTTVEQHISVFQDLYTKLAHAALDEQAVSLLTLLASHRRLVVLPEILALYKRYCAEREKVLEVELVSAKPVDQRRQDAIVEALKSRLQANVTLHCSEDESLLGGAIIRFGDRVIDGSLRGRLNRLRRVLEVSTL